MHDHGKLASHRDGGALRVADRNAIALKEGREIMGRPRLPAEVWAKIAREVAASSEELVSAALSSILLGK
jgi:hypothetical protein